MRKPALGAQRLHLREEFVLAMKAALGIIALVVRIGKLVGRECLHRNRVLVRKGQRGCELCTRQRSRIGNDSQHAWAQHLMCDEREIGRVCAAGIRDEEGLKRG